MDRAADYERRAEASEAKAAQAQDTKTKRQFLELAATWRDLARQAGGLRP
jgi:hypothetical protein